MRSLTFGILAHVDAGKTTLTERLLFLNGVIDEVGSVDAGTTQTDSLDLERQRGITIKSAVVSFVVDDVSLNLIDTPGHPDFIAEVERVLSVLDGAVLVVSAVEGVQAQTRVLMRALQRLRIPTLLFVNKLDRRGAEPERVLREITEKLTPNAVAMGTVRGEGSRKTVFRPYSARDAAFTSRLVDTLADHDDALFAAYVDDKTVVSYERLRRQLEEQTKRALVHPVFFGAAITGAGLEQVIDGITGLLPSTEGDAEAPVSASVFKVERGPRGDKIAYARVFSGTIRVRDRVPLRGDSEGKVTAISVFDRGRAVRSTSVVAGQISKLWGLAEIQIGDAIGDPPMPSAHRFFGPPTLETVVVPRDPADKGALHAGLQQLAEQDPLINVRQDDVRQEIFLSLYGEVQKEVIEDTLASDFGIEVEFRETTPIYIERPTGVGEAVEVLGEPSNPFEATVGLRVEPAPIDAGVEFRLDVDVGVIPLYVFKSVGTFRDAIEETVRTTLQQGLYGWEVTDCVVTMTECGYSSPGTTAADYRKLAPLVLMSALKEAATEVCEPINRFRVDGPADSLQPTLRLLAQLRAEPHVPTIFDSSFVLEGDIPAARLHLLQQQIQAATRGEGVLEFRFERYQPVADSIPTRARSDNNPLNREEYLLHVVRRVAGP